MLEACDTTTNKDPEVARRKHIKFNTHEKVQKMFNRGFFLDRDGVINVDHGFVHRVEQIEFIDGIFDLIKFARKCGYMIFIITNQSGIGRGLYSESDFHQLMHWLLNKFDQSNASVDHVYFSPFHPIHGTGKYRKDEQTRKPKPGMILQARDDYDLDLKSSVLVGDRKSDIFAGLAAGIGTNLLLQADNQTHSTDNSFITISSLYEVMHFL